MSAFLVSTQTMAKVAASIRAFTEYTQPSATHPHLDALWYLKTMIDRQLITALLNLNCAALNARYGEDDCPDSDQYVSEALEFLPELVDTAKRAKAYGSRSKDRLADYLKALDCFLYQCCEGTIDETANYLAIEHVRGMVALELAQSTPAYDKAQWG